MFVVTVDPEVCVGCGQCAQGCPAEIFAMADGKAVPNEDECLGCQSCVAICPVAAVTVEEF